MKRPLAGAAVALCAMLPVAANADMPPQPRPKPEMITPESIVAGAARAVPAAASSFAPAAARLAEPPRAELSRLSSALDAALKGDSRAATAAQRQMQDPVAQSLVEWAMIRSGGVSHDHARLAGYLAGHGHWPNSDLAHRRIEQALLRSGATKEAVLSALGGKAPSYIEGRLALADAYRASGEEAATAHARAAWHRDDMSEARERDFLRRHGDDIRPADHRMRMLRLLFDGEFRSATRTAERLGSADRAVARAFIAVSRGAGDAQRRLDDVPRSARSNPGYQYARVNHLRRADRTDAAVRALLAAGDDPRRWVGDDAWYLERAILARRLIERRDYDTAYRVMAAHRSSEGREWSNAEFLAGWLALRFLDRPEDAEEHFRRMTSGVSMPISLGRSYYWLGRALEAQDRSAAAEKAYKKASEYNTTFYGQLALARTGAETLGLAPRHLPSATDRAMFDRDDLVRAVRLLVATDNKGLTVPFLVALADRMDTPGTLSLLGDLATEIGGARYTLIVGKRAAQRGAPADAHAFPTHGIPSFSPVGPEVDTALVYSIARQESAFHVEARSPANALGLLQLLPGTARQTAGNYGLSYSLARLTSDPAYNAALGSAYLGENLARYDGSLIMTFAAYNAGRGRVNDWIKAFGDPRSGRIDPVDWIELIPFSETRSYVQRIMENLQVYRARLYGTDTPLTIEKDLRIGSAGS